MILSILVMDKYLYLYIEIIFQYERTKFFWYESMIAVDFLHRFYADYLMELPAWMDRKIHHSS